MPGCASRASSVPSRAKRSCPPRSSSARLTQLDRHRALEASVAAVGEPHRAHAAHAERAFQRVGADRLAGELHGRVVERRQLEEVRRREPVVLGEQAVEERRPAPVRRRRSAATKAARGFRLQVERLVEQRAERLPEDGVQLGHGRTGHRVDHRNADGSDSGDRSASPRVRHSGSPGCAAAAAWADSSPMAALKCRPTTETLAIATSLPPLRPRLCRSELHCRPTTEAARGGTQFRWGDGSRPPTHGAGPPPPAPSGPGRSRRAARAPRRPTRGRAPARPAAAPRARRGCWCRG